MLSNTFVGTMRPREYAAYQIAVAAGKMVKAKKEIVQMETATQKAVWHVRNFSNAELVAALRGRGACRDSVRWIGNRDAAAAWAACDDIDWIDWMISNAKGQFGLPARAEYQPKWDAIYAERLNSIKALIAFDL